MPIRCEIEKLEWNIYQTTGNNKNKGGGHFAPYHSDPPFNIAHAYYFDVVVVLDAGRPTNIPPMRNIRRRYIGRLSILAFLPWDPNGDTEISGMIEFQGFPKCDCHLMQSCIEKRKVRLPSPSPVKNIQPPNLERC